MIPTVPEPGHHYKEFRVYEDCYFKCGNKAKDWHWRTNQPVCKECAKTRKVGEIKKCTPNYKPPTKIEYLKDL